ncbi:Ubiquitin-like protein 1 [Parelaphostrongylus tenuis]|uniref:Ubiquitin-like protein 1 n=1 Tax=Parelaphostrongylus tenuis TaxID=148309 RepID=A0AAD5N7U2_PARTN|nr:Ubiquitin-like protein 1 [Parelaphostrongylus tenuis]
MVLVKTLTGRTLVLDVLPDDNVLSIKRKIASSEGVAVEDQRLILAGRQLSDDEGVDDSSTLHLSLRLLGGAKKRKKKVYTTPKKIKHKRKKVKLAVLKYYEVDDNGKIRRLRVECQSPSCGGGVFMAAHENRYYCGRCHDTLVVEEPVATSKSKGGKGKK